jgi:hypothetical protein
MCHYSGSRVGGSGYYVAGCTDSTYSSETCPQRCNNQPVKDAVFVSQPARLWKCCGAHPVTGEPWCDKPTEENFDAKRPGRLETVWQAGVGPPSPTSATTGTGGHDHGHGQDTSTPSATPSDMVAATNMSGISPAMAGGIAAATAVGTLLFSLLVIHLVQRRQRKEVKETTAAEMRWESGARARVAIMGNDGQETTIRTHSPFDHTRSGHWPLKDDLGVNGVSRSTSKDERFELPAYNKARQ